MRTFQISQPLQHGALLHMATTAIGKEEKKNLKLIFDALDDEKDGEIELKELVVQLHVKFETKVTLKDMEKVMRQCDLNFDGKISLTEFLIATSNKRMLFSDYNLQECFNFIDQNRDGFVCKDDLSKFMGREVSD